MPPDEQDPIDALENAANPPEPSDFPLVEPEPEPAPTADPPSPSLAKFRESLTAAPAPTPLAPAAPPPDPYAQFTDTELVDLAKVNPKFGDILQRRQQNAILAEHRKTLAQDFANTQEAALADVQALTKYPQLNDKNSEFFRLFHGIRTDLASGGYVRADINLQAAEMAHARLAPQRAADRSREARIENGTQFPKPTSPVRTPAGKANLNDTQKVRAASMGITHPDDQAAVAEELRRGHERLIREGRI